jgi:hypothetical protein
LQAICDGLSAAKIDGLLRKWLRLVPHPFTAADREAGYRYDISFHQAEFSLTQVLDRQVHGGVFFEQGDPRGPRPRRVGRDQAHLQSADAAPVTDAVLHAGGDTGR